MTKQDLAVTLTNIAVRVGQLRAASDVAKRSGTFISPDSLSQECDYLLSKVSELYSLLGEEAVEFEKKTRILRTEDAP